MTKRTGSNKPGASVGLATSVRHALRAKVLKEQGIMSCAVRGTGAAKVQHGGWVVSGADDYAAVTWRRSDYESESQAGDRCLEVMPIICAYLSSRGFMSQVVQGGRLIRVTRP